MKSGICYEIKKNGKTKGYLMGSMHLFDETIKLKTGIKKAFKESSVLVLETDLNKALEESNAGQKELMSNGLFLEKGRTIEDELITEEDRRYYEKIMNTIGFKRYLIPKTMNIDFLKILYCSKIYKKHKVNPAKGIDRYFYKLSLTSKKPCHYLEDLDFQKKLANNILIEMENKTPDRSCESLEKIEEGVIQINQMITAYKNDNATELLNILKKDLVNYSEELIEDVYDNRNISMANSIDKIITSKSKPFICIGLGHLLFGEKNLLNLLKNKGYSAYRIVE